MLRKFLFVLTDEIELNELEKFAKALKEYYPNIEKNLLYVKDVMKYDIFPLTVQGMGISNATNLIIEDYLKLEEEKFNNLKNKLDQINSFKKVYSIEGELLEVVLEELKAYDALVVCKSGNDTITDDLNSLLKNHYKPLIILSKSDKEYKFDKILMLNDGGYRVNASVYQYFNIFGDRDIDVLRVNVEDKNRLTERFGRACNIIDKSGDVVDIILKTIPNYDFALMGNLSYSLLFEKLTGQVGVKVLENTRIPIFMS